MAWQMAKNITKVDEDTYDIEIYDYIEAFHSLQFSAAGSRVYNPTLIEVWFVNHETLYSVKPGQTISLD